MRHHFDKTHEGLKDMKIVYICQLAFMQPDRDRLQSFLLGKFMGTIKNSPAVNFWVCFCFLLMSLIYLRDVSLIRLKVQEGLKVQLSPHLPAP